MDKVLSSCRDCVSTYVEDVLVYSADWDVHKKDLGRVLAALESAGITAKPGKCQFGRQHVEYLGHVIGCGSLAIPEHRVTAIRDYKRPVNKKDMRAFLGHFRKFVQNFEDQSSILTPATVGAKKKFRTVLDCTFTVLDCTFTVLDCTFTVLDCTFTYLTVLLPYLTVLDCTFTVLDCTFTVLDCTFTVLDCTFTVLDCTFTVLDCTFTVLDCTFTYLPVLLPYLTVLLPT